MRRSLGPSPFPDLVVTNATLVPCTRLLADGKLEVIRRATLVVEEGRITALLGESDVRRGWPQSRVVEVDQALVTPGLVDAHTHIVFAGDRADEFERRVRGETYGDIARCGGGIIRTVIATRATPDDELERLVRTRLKRFLSFGVTTVEAKTGYGLDAHNELRMLRLLKRAAIGQPVEIVPTFLGAHVVPPEYSRDRAGYVDLMVRELLPEIAFLDLATFCDVFVEDGAFSVDEARTILEAALMLGLRPKLHAEQFSTTGAAELAARLGATSADHLEHVTPEGIAALAAARVVAVLLPGAALGPNHGAQARLAPARAIIAGGVDVALSTDLNPGTSMTENLPLMGTLACMRYGMTPDEALAALTCAAARAVGLSDRIGSLEVGKDADFVVWNVRSVGELFCHFGVSHAARVFKGGREVLA